MSEKLKLSKKELIKVAKGAGITAGGALLTYGTQMISKYDFGAWTPIVVAAFAVLVNFGRKFILVTKE